MVGEHDRIIHFVYMIACQDQNIFRVISLNNVDVLEHRIRSAAIPRIFRHTLLGRQQINMFVQFVLHERPATLQMAQQTVGLVLRGQANAAYARIDAVGEGEINNAKLAAKINGGFCTAVGQLFQAATASPSQHHGKTLGG